MKISEVKELLNQDNISEEILNELKKDERMKKNHFTKINVIIMDVSIFAE